MAEWASLPTDILDSIAEHFDFFEDFFSFCLVCKSWQSASTSGKTSRTLPPRCPWVMLTDVAETNFPEVTRDMRYKVMLAEEVEKNEHIEGMDKRRFYSFSTSKIYEFELPEATRKRCFGVSNGWLMTVGYDLQINLLHPFSRLQVGVPPLLSFKDQYKYEIVRPESVIANFVRKAVMSSNPYNSSNEDCIVLAIYGQVGLLAFARPGDKVWTDIYPRIKCNLDVVYFRGKFYAIDDGGIVVVCDIQDGKRPKQTPIARIPVGLFGADGFYLVESSGSLLVVLRFRKGPHYNTINSLRDTVNHIQRGVDVKDIEQVEQHSTVSFSIFKLEECRHGDKNIDKYPYKLRQDRDGSIATLVDKSYEYPYKSIPVKNLGDRSLFVGFNASASLPCSNNVKANHIYFSEDNSTDYGSQPFGGGPDTGMYDVENGKITYHDASKFKSHLTPPMWYI